MSVKLCIILALLILLSLTGWRLYAAGQSAEQVRTELQAYKEKEKNIASSVEAAEKADNESKDLAAKVEKEVVYVNKVPVANDCDSAPVDVAIDILRDKAR